MTNEQLKEKILSLVPGAQFMENKQFAEFVIPAEKFHELALALKNSDDTAFDYLVNLTGVDLMPDLMVVYHLKSTKHGSYIVLKQKTSDRENPEFDTVSDIWITAEWHEREAFDLFGIRFKNHPDMRRILMDEQYQGYPLRKDFVDEINIIER
jgi:NADH:ubiquinone oxidoreductase subunit C